LTAKKIKTLAAMNVAKRLNLEKFLPGCDCDVKVGSSSIEVQSEPVGQGLTSGKRLRAVCSNISAISVVGIFNIDVTNETCGVVAGAVWQVQFGWCTGLCTAGLLCVTGRRSMIRRW